jgi:hypothetical protein
MQQKHPRGRFQRPEAHPLQVEGQRVQADLAGGALLRGGLRPPQPALPLRPLPLPGGQGVVRDPVRVRQPVQQPDPHLLPHRLLRDAGGDAVVGSVHVAALARADRLQAGRVRAGKGKPKVSQQFK